VDEEMLKTKKSLVHLEVLGVEDITVLLTE
jgi:hypothetical protein